MGHAVGIDCRFWRAGRHEPHTIKSLSPETERGADGVGAAGGDAMM